MSDYTVHRPDRYQTPLSDEEMRSGIDRRGVPIERWIQRNADGTYDLAAHGVERDDECDAWMVRLRLATTHGNLVHYDYADQDEYVVMYRAEIAEVDAAAGDLTIRPELVARGQIWPYVPPKVDVERMLEVLRGLAGR